VQPHPLYKRLGREITQRRKALRITQQSLADAIGISRAAVANIERGEQRVFFDQIVAIASYLGAKSVDELLNTDFHTPSLASTRVSFSGANLSRSERAEVRRLLEELGSV
jgi:transcriptional regulator with XRE-family HTH domain